MNNVKILKEFDYKELRVLEVIQHGDLSRIAEELYPFNTQGYKKVRKVLLGEINDNRVFVELWKINNIRFKSIGKDFRSFIESNLKKVQINAL